MDSVLFISLSSLAANLAQASALPPGREAVIALAIYLNSQAVSLGFRGGAC